MKLAEMYLICDNQKGKCEGCMLNCVSDWQEKCTTWCLISLKRHYIKLYQKAINENDEETAEKIMNAYNKLEKEYLER